MVQRHELSDISEGFVQGSVDFQAAANADGRLPEEFIRVDFQEIHVVIHSHNYQI